MKEIERPKLKIPFTKIDVALEILAVLILLSFCIFNWINYDSLPEIIPIHFRGNGTVDGYGSKITLALLPLLGIILYGGLTYLGCHPEKFNYTTEITADNARKQYTIAVKMLRVMKLSIVIVFFAIDYKSIQIAHNSSLKLEGWFMFLIMSLILVPLFYFLIKFSNNS